MRPLAPALLFVGLLTGLALASYRSPVPERAPPSILVSVARPTVWTIDNGRLAIDLALSPRTTVTDWWWGNNGGIAAIRLDGRDLLTPRGMPERWDIDNFEVPAKGVKLMMEVGWSSKDPAVPVPGPTPLLSRIAVQGTTIICMQELPPFGGYAYRLERRIELMADEPVLWMSWRLVNTGDKPLALRHFIHGYWNLGGGPIDESYRIDTVLRPQPAEGLWQELPGGLRIAAPVGQSRIAQPAEIDPALPAWWCMRNDRTGLQVAVRGDFPPALFALYVESGAIVPELSTRQLVDVDAEVTWSRCWTFSAER